MQKIPIFRAVEILIGLSVVLLLIGNFSLIAGDRAEVSDKKEEILGDTSESKEEEPSPTPTDIPSAESVDVEIKTEVNSNPTSTPIPEENSDSPVGQDFIYPGAVSTGGNSYETSDGADTVTDWYRDQIVSRNMNVKTFVTTKTNGNVLNKLAGANGTIEINVEIEREEGSSKTTIRLGT